jgi:hypothetical protein
MNEVSQAVLYLKKSHVDKKRDDKQIYKTIIIDVLAHIRKKDDVGRNNMTYRVPFIVYGNPRYDINKATYYIMKELARCGLVVFPYENNHVYVDWSMLNNKEKHEKHEKINDEKNNNRGKMVRFEKT